LIKLPIAALVVIVALLGGFYGGYKIGGGGTASAATNSNGTANRTGNAFNGRGAFAACPSASPAASASGAAARRAATGTVTNLTNTTLTVHDTRCNTDEKVTFDQSVIVRETTVGKASDLQENDTISVIGTRQADGSIKANTITIVPAGAGGFGAFGGGNGGGGQP
jgi:hypothetical protein